MSKCPNGMYAEIKYDGERIQIHKKGDEFACYSRNLKPVMEYKIKDVKVTTTTTTTTNNKQQ